jgi:tRNA pseudouridine38-40 synthase
VHAIENLATCWFLPPFDAEVFESAVSVDRPDGLVNVVAESTGFHTHARNVGRGKWYRYRLRLDGEPDERAWTMADPLRIDVMHELARAFVGEHDFSAYSYKCSSPNTVKTVTRVDLTVDSSCMVIDIEGNGFLRHMVRKMVSTMVAVGSGEFDLDEALTLLASGSPRGTPRAAPANGLTLMAIRRRME